MMNEKKPNKIIDVTFILSTLLCFGPMIFGLIMWKKLPEQMPIHFNAAGIVVVVVFYCASKAEQ